MRPHSDPTPSATARARAAKPRSRVESGIPVDEVYNGDLRRRRTRAMIEHLVERAVHLPPDDAALIQAVYGEGKNVADLAPLLKTDPRRLRRRVRTLVRRLADPEFVFVAARAEQWGRTRRLVASACVLQGRPMRRAAEDLGLSLHTVRKHCAAVRALFDEARAGGLISA